jgi:esterase/lipase
VVQDKNIRIIYAESDGIIHVEKTSNYIKHKLIHNTINVDVLDVSHHLILEEESPLYEDINNFIKEN